MTLIPWKSKDRARDIQRSYPSYGAYDPAPLFRTEMDRLFSRFFGGLDQPWDDVFGGGEWLPAFDVSDTDTEVTVRAEVPGVDPKQLEITVSGDMLTIAGEKRDTVERKGEHWFQSERRFGQFRRSIQLPAAVDADKVSADHSNGVVTITLPKLEQAKPKRVTVKPA